MNNSDFLQKVQKLKDSGTLTPGKVAEMQPGSKLNIVFDIDHTLIFAIDKNYAPNLDKHQFDGYAEIKTIRMGKYNN